MTYIRKPNAALGDTFSTAQTVIATASNVVQDPYFPETLCRVNQLMDVERKQPVRPCVPTPPGRAGGVGLRSLMRPLRAYVYAEQNRWVYPVAGAAVIGVPLLLGILIGRGGR